MKKHFAFKQNIAVLLLLGTILSLLMSVPGVSFALEESAVTSESSAAETVVEETSVETYSTVEEVPAEGESTDSDEAPADSSVAPTTTEENTSATEDPGTPPVSEEPTVTEPDTEEESVPSETVQEPEQEEEEPVEDVKEETPVILPTPEPVEEVSVTEQVLRYRGKGVEISVSGPLPVGGRLSVSEIMQGTQEYDGYTQKATERVAEENALEEVNLAYARFFDITILYGEDAKEFQPSTPVAVKINLKDNLFQTEGAEVSTLHFEEESKQETPNFESMTANIVEANTDGAVTFEANGFSVYGVVTYYTVDFYYYGPLAKHQWEEIITLSDDPDKPDQYQLIEKHPFDKESTEYHIPGGSSILLSDLVEYLEIERDWSKVKRVSFSDDTLVSVTTQDGDYLITSLSPFTTGEMLTIFLEDESEVNGEEELVIHVFDYIAAPASFGSGLTWEITDEGKLIIRPTTEGGTGTLPNASSFGGTPPSNADLAAVWPWEDASLRAQITAIEIQEGVQTTSNHHLRYMFYGLTNLTDVDLSGLDASNVNVINDMFRGCSSLQSIDLSPMGVTSTLQQVNRLFQDCTSLTSVTWKDAPLIGISQTTSTYANCNSSIDLDFSGSTFGSVKSIDLLKTVPKPNEVNISNCTFYESAASAFENKTTLQSVDMSGATFDAGAQAMFKGCNALTSVDASNATFNGTCQQMFMNCTSLSSVDASGATFRGSCYELFRGDSSLTSVDFSGADGSAVQSFGFMFDACSSLTQVDLSSLNAQNVTSVVHMFRNCASLTTLNISNLKCGSGVGNGNTGLHTCTALNTIIAENSNLKLRANEAVSENTSNISFPKGDWIVNSTGLQDDGTELEYNEVVRLIANGSGTSVTYTTLTNNNANGFLPSGTYVRASDATSTSTGFSEVPETFYLINNLYNSDYVIDIDRTVYDVYVQQSDGSYIKADENTTIPGNSLVAVYTKMQDQAEWTSQGATYEYAKGNPNREITVTYKKAVTDVNGKVHDLAVTINGFEFQKMDELTYGYGITYNKPMVNPAQSGHFLFTANVGNLSLKNYIVNTGMLPTVEYAPDGKPLTGDKTCYTGSKGGTYTSFTLTVPDSEPNSTILFFVEDLDVTATTSPSNTWGPGAEGLILQGGVEVDTVTFSDPDPETGVKNTKLTRYYQDSQGNWLQATSPSDPNWDSANYIVGSASSVGGDLDPNCRFYVRADATASVYTWTSGTGCQTELLNPNGIAGEFRDLPDLYITPIVKKTMDGLMPDAQYDGAFTFELTYAASESGVNPVDAEDLPTQYSQSGVKNEDNQAFFNTMKFEHPMTDDSNQYNVHTYIYEIKESPAASSVNDDPLLEYTKDKVYIRVMTYNPENDPEMHQGFKAVVTVGRKAEGDTSITWDDSSTTVWSDSLQPAMEVGLGNQVEDGGVLYPVYTDIYGVAYYKKGGKYYSADTKTELTIAAGLFFPTDDDSASKGHLSIMVDGKQYKIYISGDGTRFYVKDGKYYAAGDKKVDTNGVPYYLSGGTYYAADSDNKVLRSQPGVFEPQSSDATLVADGTELSGSELATVVWMVNGYPVKKDKDGVNYYYNTSDGKYYSPAGTELTVKTGVLHPADNDDTVMANKTIEVDGSQYPLKVDIHGVTYYAKDGKFYKEDGTEIEIQNTIFNPVDAVDKAVQEVKTVTLNGTDYVVKEDEYGTQYIVKDNQYCDLSGNPIAVWSGDVEPQTTDRSVEINKTHKELVYEVVSGNNYPVYRDRNRNKYYVDGNGVYHSMNGSVLVSGVDINPSPNDQQASNEYSVYIDENNVEYYRKEGRYFKLSDNQPYSLGQNVLDDIAYFTAGTLDNSFKRADITVVKKTTDNKTGTFKFRISFDKAYDPSGYIQSNPYSISSDTMADLKRIDGNEWAKTGEPVVTPILDEDGTTVLGYESEYQFSRIEDGNTIRLNIKVRQSTKDDIITESVEMHTTGGTYSEIAFFDLDYDPAQNRTSFTAGDGMLYEIDFSNAGKELIASPNIWEFTLEENQQIVFKELPSSTNFNIVEEVLGKGWYQIEIRDKDGIMMDNGAKATEVDGTITTTDSKDYVYTFVNQYTEVAINKFITGNMGNRTHEFEFSVKFTGLKPNEVFYYAIEDETFANRTSIPFITAVANAAGEYTIPTFKLGDKQSRYLVVPYDAGLSVSEDNGDYKPYVIKKTSLAAQSATNFDPDDTRDVPIDVTASGQEIYQDRNGNNYTRVKDSTEDFYSYYGIDGSDLEVRRQSNTISLRPGYGDIVLDFENNMNAAVPTEIRLRPYDWFPFFVLVLWGFFFLYRNKRRKDDWEDDLLIDRGTGN